MEWHCVDAPMASTRPFEVELNPSHFDQRRRLDSRQQLNPMESNPIESNPFGLGLGFEQSVEGVFYSTKESLDTTIRTGISIQSN